MAVEAGSALRALRDALRDLLVEEHVGMAPRLAVVEAEGIAGVEAAEPRVLVEFALGHRTRSAVLRVRNVDRQAIGVELRGPIDTPTHRIGRHLVDLDAPDERRAGLLTVLENGYQQRGNAERHQGDDGQQGREEQQAAASPRVARMRDFARR